MEEKRKITSGNKIPGCEKLTRPEEIKGLSKYLGAIRDTQEQWISENMPDSPLSRPEDAKLKTIKLPDKRLKLDGTKEIVLPNQKERLSPGEVESLPDSVLRISPENPNSLPEGKERLRNITDPKLPLGKERLVIEEPSELPDSLIKIDVSDPELPKDKKKIYPQENVSLPKSKETLNNISDPKLPEGFVELQREPKDIKLPGRKEGLLVKEPSELPGTRIDISPEEPNDLRQHIEGLFAEEPDSLRQKRLGLNITEPDRLPNEILEINPKDPDKLPNTRLDINPRDPKLPNVRLDIKPEDPELPNVRLDIKPEDPELPNSRLDIKPEDPELPNSRLDIKPEEIEELPGDRLSIDIPDIKRIEEVLDSMSANELYEEVMNLLVPGQTGAESSGQGNMELAGIISAYLGDQNLTNQRAQEVSQKIIDTLQKQKKLLNYAGYVGRDGLDREATLEEKATKSQSLDIPEKESILSKYTEQKYRQEYGEENRIPRIKYQVSDNEDPTKNPTSFLNPALYDQDRYIRRLAELAADRGVDLMTSSLNGVSADLNIGKISSASREYILKNTLMALVMARNKLERATKTDRSRLPGGNIIWQGVQKLVQGGLTGYRGVEGAIRGVGTLAINTIANETALPQNRPEGSSNIWTGQLEGTKTEKLKRLNKESANSSISKQFIPSLKADQSRIEEEIKKNNSALLSTRSTIESFIDRGDEVSGAILNSLNSTEGDLIQKSKLLSNQLGGLSKNISALAKGEIPLNTFLGGYFAGKGIALTLKDLCPNIDADKINTLEDFKQALIKSPYITTPEKLMKREDGNLTLDTNAYWEVVIEPYVSDEQNGGWSYLPSIAEINTENRVEHNHKTRYSSWIPINGFELQKSKLVSKTVGLYDGEISYPVSVEYTNELRISVVDDQYKSWRRYFQRCADVSTYFSEAHNDEFYRQGLIQCEATPTAIDKSMICIAYYKNVTFRVRIYCMTPQYSTIKKFDLLCVMKDFGEEYAGEIDGGGQDLSISFSIVGENPDIYETQLNKIIKAKLREAASMTGEVKEVDDASSSDYDNYSIVSTRSHGFFYKKH